MTIRPAGTSHRRRFRVLSASLLLGALYDFLFAGLMLAAPGVLASTFALPLPGESFYLRLLAVLLAMLGFTYVVAARDPQAQRPLVAIAILGRCAGFGVLALSAAGAPRLAGLWAPAIGDLAFAAVHAAAGRELWR